MNKLREIMGLRWDGQIDDQECARQLVAAGYSEQEAAEAISFQDALMSPDLVISRKTKSAPPPP